MSHFARKHLRRFHGMDDAKEIWEAIRTRFGDNENSKKMQKAVLKQQSEAFTISSSEGLEKGYDRFQQLLSQLEAHGAEVSTEDANHKFLRSLPPAWSWNYPRDFAKLVKAISLPQHISSTSDRHLIELKNQVQRLMEAHFAPKSPVQVNKIASSCEICSGPHDTQYCMENLEQAFVDFASSRTDEAGGKWFTFKPEQNNIGDTYNPSWKSYPNLRWRQPQNSQNNFSNPPNRFQPSVLEVLAHAPMYNAILDKYVESLELGKSGSAFIQGEIPEKMKDPGLFTLPCRLGDSKLFDILADLGSCVNLIPLYLFKKLKIGLLEETDHVFGLADGTKSYPVWQMARDAVLNPFKDVLVFRKMVEFLGAIRINLKRNMWESEELIKKKVDWNRPAKEGDGAWHIRIDD
ncbi:hypothetical protein Tco_0236163 [Tanacetum coccineum]